MSNNGNDKRVAFYSIAFCVILAGLAILFAMWYDRDNTSSGINVKDMPACVDDGTSSTGKYPCFFDGKKDGNGRGDSYISRDGTPEGIIYITTQK